MKLVVIGGSGFLGRHVVEECLKKGYETWIFDIYKPNYKTKAIFFKGSIIEIDDLNKCLKEAQAIIHCASPPEILNDIKIFNQVNVDGSKNIIKACKQNNVKYIVLTSSASVVYEGKDVCDGKETLPYAESYLSPYIKTKIEQEKIFLQENDSTNNLLTIAIRPHGLFGPGDKQMVPHVLKAAKENKMKFVVGDGKNLVDFTYVKNVAYGMVLALDALKEGKPVSGQAFNVTNDEPVYFWDFIERILTYNGYTSPKYHLPAKFIMIIAHMLSFIAFVLAPLIKLNFTFSPMRVALISTHHYYNCDKAKKLLNYKPKYTLEEGFMITMKALHENN